ncbi:MAG: hypothetical protein JKP90_11555 [Desulfofustis sp. PB-SRB1]|jgi:hypothetical protein|nr:hypothetical protein [Desulfofustis sp. PB-SRB1]
MGTRYEKLGIKQTVRKQWMDKTVQMMLAGLTENDIRAELNQYLSTQKQSGGIGERGRKTYGMAIAILSAWFAPAQDLLSFRNNALSIAGKKNSDQWLPLHWAVISASYPFWFNVARHAGRLFNLQEYITQQQIFYRLKEQYGDRETVLRNARYTVRSFVSWGVLKDTEKKGCYRKTTQISIADYKVAIILLESALLASREKQSIKDLLYSNPAFFPFELPMLSGEFIVQHSEHLDLIRYNFDDELLKLKIL